MQWSEAKKLYATSLRAKLRSEKTVTWYAEQFVAFDRWRDENALPDELPDADTIEAFLAEQQLAALRPATVNARFRAIRAIFNFLEKRRRIAWDENPIRMLEAPDVPREARRYVTLDDYNRLQGVIDEYLLMPVLRWLELRDKLILIILYYSGLRVGELVGLHDTDVNVDALEILVRKGKGAKSRIVPCVPELADVYRHYVRARPAHPSGLLILASDGYFGTTGALAREGVRQMLIRRCAQALIYPAFSPHAFRHGFAMWLLNAGARMTTVSTIMGHADPGITMKIYAHTLPSTARSEYGEALRRLG